LIDEKEIEKLRALGVKSYSKTPKGTTIEFFDPAPAPRSTAPAQDLSPLGLHKAFVDSMPPDSEMQFASADPIEITDSNHTPTQGDSAPMA
jgi:hypothetical protein